jgi:hypothetical protein
MLMAELGGLEQLDQGTPPQSAPGVVGDHHRTGPAVDPNRLQPAAVAGLMHQVGQQPRRWLGLLGHQPQPSWNGMHNPPTVAAAGADDTIT